MSARADNRGDKFVVARLIRLDHLDTLAWTSVRHALEQKTLVVESVCDAIREVAPHLRDDTLELIVQDIRDAKEDWSSLGHGFDRKWATLVEWIEEHRWRRGLRSGGSDE